MLAPDLPSYDHTLVAIRAARTASPACCTCSSSAYACVSLELHHHDVDGGRPFMDWVFTPAYLQAVARHVQLPLYTSWREGGFHRELHRKDAATAPVGFETLGRALGVAGGRGSLGTRGRFLQVSSDLRERWCSAALRIDVLPASICNQPRFRGARTLVVTGERGEESASRARYAVFEPHRTHTRSRHVDHWRPVHARDEAQVWAIVARHRGVPHPAYALGWSRLSCRACIFGGPDQGATLRAVFPTAFEEMARRRPTRD